MPGESAPEEAAEYFNYRPARQRQNAPDTDLKDDPGRDYQEWISAPDEIERETSKKSVKYNFYRGEAGPQRQP